MKKSILLSCYTDTVGQSMRMLTMMYVQATKGASEYQKTWPVLVAAVVEKGLKSQKYITSGDSQVLYDNLEEL